MVKQKKILVLGATGMAGHAISLYLSENGYDVTTFSRRPFAYCKNIVGDAFDTLHIKSIILENSFDVLINCIGLLNKECDKYPDRAVFLNSYFPHFLDVIARDKQIKLIHISTDCVFSGDNGPYYENSYKDGKSFYDKTKALGEVYDDDSLTFRCSIIGPDINKNGVGLFNWFMQQNGCINGYERVVWSGITTFELARAIDMAIKTNLKGLYHLSTKEPISKNHLLQIIKETFHKNIDIIAYDAIVSNKVLINTRTDFVFEVRNYRDMIRQMYDWTLAHKELYPHYFN